ncbi:GxxExxY protein [Parafilimonas terrae]|uniref:GxxExxY protein n=1 Tax=Parafilimonas terrae TaxID=1465490 RepID=A0A1I5SCT0_9BACT|nr:GxxExxY protein [Parafilimonas terrae]SFP68588.1 GxxExxY protein [Parafilimonas terrae]
MEEINTITYKIRGAVFSIYNQLGPGLLESVYETVLAFELRDMGLYVQTQVPVPVIYRNIRMEVGFRADIIVNDLVIIEIKSVETLHDVHKKQLLTYLKLTNKHLGILVNFNVSKLIDKENIIRIIN